MEINFHLGMVACNVRCYAEPAELTASLYTIDIKIEICKIAEQPSQYNGHYVVPLRWPL